MPTAARSLAAGALALLAAACASSGTAAQQPTGSATSPSGPAASGTASQVTPPPVPQAVGVTTAGTLVLYSSSWSPVRTLATGVLGDEVSVAANGSVVYFAAGRGCQPEIESVPLSGGAPTRIVQGSVPAVSPDGTKLAYTTQIPLTQACIQANPHFATSYKVAVRTLSSGATRYLGLPAQLVTSELVPPVSHLSWAADNTRLAVSVSPVQDNEGWNLNIVITSAATGYDTGPGVTSVPVTGLPTPRNSYIREGIFLPDGDMFISRACCAGIPPRHTSELLWEVAQSGILVHQVAVGFTERAHTSLSVSADGQWLLYLSGPQLYVSHDGGPPQSPLAAALIAAAWVTGTS